MVLNAKEKLVRTAAGEEPADLILKNVRVLNVFTGELEKENNIAISGARIAGVGPYTEAENIIDMNGAAAAPGFIDAHIHPEYSRLRLEDFGRALLKKGVTTAIACPRDIINVSGALGLRYLLAAGAKSPLSYYFTIPQGPSDRELQTISGLLTDDELEQALRHDRVLGILRTYDEKCRPLDSRFEDGESTADDWLVGGLCRTSGEMEINAAFVAGVKSDYSSNEIEDGREKLRRGMRLVIIEGSLNQNLETFKSLITPSTASRCIFASGSISFEDLPTIGIDSMVRKAIELGIPRTRSYCLASITAADYYGLRNCGAIAPGFVADIIILDDIDAVTVSRVFKRGEEVLLDDAEAPEVEYADDSTVRNLFEVGSFVATDFEISAETKIRPVIEVDEDPVFTSWAEITLTGESDRVRVDIGRDIVKIAVVERHLGGSNIGVALIKGLGLKHGAVATSISYDAHNITVAGVSDEDIARACAEVVRMQGGLAASVGGEIVCSLNLPIAGILTDRRPEQYRSDIAVFNNSLADLCRDPNRLIRALAHVADVRLPEIRLTDKGLVDTINKEIIEGV